MGTLKEVQVWSQKLIPGLLDDSREMDGALISNNSIFWTSYQDILLLLRAYSVASTFALCVINSLGLLNNHIVQFSSVQLLSCVRLFVTP